MYILVALFLAVLTALPASAQIAPTEAELRAYGGLHAAAARGDVADIEKRIASGENKEAVDRRHRERRCTSPSTRRSTMPPAP